MQLFKMFLPNLIEASLEEINIVELGQLNGKLTGRLKLAHFYLTNGGLIKDLKQ